MSGQTRFFSGPENFVKIFCVVKRFTGSENILENFTMPNAQNASSGFALRIYLYENFEQGPCSAKS